ncbi:hypothetical protein E2C01_030898 [Portunus trituberculatus]|uniref:Uncharacterized protein n=1 Tax=Portunus trituberculatus TaxID=210409 RepID=A0A5B7ERM7_PORTR|nr:hypothetical protein [Portunus trituberculatus]
MLLHVIVAQLGNVSEAMVAGRSTPRRKIGNSLLHKIDNLLVFPAWRPAGPDILLRLSIDHWRRGNISLSFTALTIWIFPLFVSFSSPVSLPTSPNSSPTSTSTSSSSSSLLS